MTQAGGKAGARELLIGALRSLTLAHSLTGKGFDRDRQLI